MRSIPLRVEASTKSKYGAVRTKVDGVTFASKAEARRYGELKLLEKAGEIQDLELQPKFPLHAPQRGWGVKVIVGTYIADFRYWEGPKGILRVEDVKGFDTPLSKWKRKHVAAQYGITVEIVR